MDKKMKLPKRHCMTDRQAARYVAHTHPLERQVDEKPEDFVLRIVRAYDFSKDLKFFGRR